MLVSVAHHDVCFDQSVAISECPFPSRPKLRRIPATPSKPIEERKILAPVRLWKPHGLRDLLHSFKSQTGEIDEVFRWQGWIEDLAVEFDSAMFNRHTVMNDAFDIRGLFIFSTVEHRLESVVPALLRLHANPLVLRKLQRQFDILWHGEDASPNRPQWIVIIAITSDFLASADRASFYIAVLRVRLANPGAAIRACCCYCHFFLHDCLCYKICNGWTASGDAPDAATSLRSESGMSRMAFFVKKRPLSHQ